MSFRNKEKNFISAVVYVKDSKQTIKDFLQTVYNTLNDNFEKFEIICVNNNSHDESNDAIRQASEVFLNCAVSIINMGYTHNLELSMNAGVDLSIGDFVFEFDSTVLDYDPSLIIKVYRKSLEGFDIVSACPKNIKSKTSKLFYRLFNKNVSESQRLTTESFRILSRRAINRVHSISKTVPYRKAVYASCGLSINHIEYENDIKIKNIEKQDNRQDIAIDSLMLFTNVAFKFSIIMTSIMICFVLFMALYSVITFLSGTPVEGWTTTILFLSASFFGVFAILAIIIKYLTLLLNLIFKKEHYFIKSIDKVTK